jgi:alpha-beta hydrolase superfamily lysophospholipase
MTPRRSMLARFLTHCALFAVYGTLGAVLAVIVAYTVYLARGPALKPWHEAPLDAEFHAADRENVRTLDDYLAAENRVFQQLRESVYERTPTAERRAANRYSAGSRSDPLSYDRDWNRTFELRADNAVGGVLLVHGLSDSPYSMRALAERLHTAGFDTLALRLPGHGTAPSGLLRVRWEDWAAAVRIGARELRDRLGAERPLYIVGYSTGAALAVEYALARAAGEALPRADALILLSPAIGVSPAAALAVWQARLALIPRLEKLAWESVGPEYDPYKYTSFAINAAVQIEALTSVISSRMEALDTGNGVSALPRILAFQSAADATVSAEALVRVLFARLAPADHELVVFDVNRHADAEPFLVPDTGARVDRLLAGPPRSFALTVMTNADAHSSAIAAVHRGMHDQTLTREATDLKWPPGVFSLSHLALPISPDDPHYGAVEPEIPQGIYLGRPRLLGERGLLAIPESGLVRLRFNPFFSYMEQRILEVVCAQATAPRHQPDQPIRDSNGTVTTSPSGSCKTEGARKPLAIRHQPIDTASNRN